MAAKKKTVKAADVSRETKLAFDVVMRPIGELIPYDVNPRVMSEEAVAGVAMSIKEYGWRQPIVVDEHDVIVAGHTRYAAAKSLGETEVPVHKAIGLTPAQVRAFRIADNRTAENTDWDNDLLELEILALQEVDFDLALTGINDAELAKLLDGEGETDVNAEWKGMPEFTQKAKTAFRSIALHFRDQQAVDDFAKLVGQNITDKTRFLWLPEIEIETYADKRYTAASPAAPSFRYGEAMPEWFTMPPAFRWLLDKDLQTNPFDRVIVREGDRVMDCGGAVGTFTVAAVEAGASVVRAYEPLPKNAAVLRGNIEPYGDRAELVEAALVADEGLKKITLAAGSSFPGTHSIVTRAKKPTNHITAEARHFRSELIAFRPNMIKLDIEGAEYGLLATLKPGDFESVNCVFIEFHPFDNRDALIRDIRKYLESEGLVVVKERLRAFTAVRRDEKPAKGKRAK